MIETRPYQQDTVRRVRQLWADGAMSVLVVAPPGSGKTVIGQLLVDEHPTLWVAHRRELVTQAADRLSNAYGAGSVGVIMPGFRPNPEARIHVGTVQTFIANTDALPAARLVVTDECHHFASSLEWHRLLLCYPHARKLGLTAVPERSDGQPLGDVFDTMVVAANYSDLIAAGHLVDATVVAPEMPLGDDIAQTPYAAWREHAPGLQAIVHCARVDLARQYAAEFGQQDVATAIVVADTPRGERDAVIRRFREGRIMVLMSVYAFDEGFDVPDVDCSILARAFRTLPGFLQATGRSLRPSPGKARALILDLSGASHVHGSPTMDREWALRQRRKPGGDGNGSEPPAYDFEQRVLGVPMAPLDGELLPNARARSVRSKESERIAAAARARRAARRAEAKSAASGRQADPDKYSQGGAV